MSFLLISYLLLPSASQASAYVWYQPWTKVPELIEILSTVPDGKKLVDRARKRNPQLLELIVAGYSSANERSGTENKPLHRVTIKRGLRLSDAVADLAHELVHFTEKRAFDPYHGKLELLSFVRNGVEGEGGELKAFEQECRISWALEKKYATFPQHRACELYRSAGDSFNEKTARNSFYAIGRWHRSFHAALKENIPELAAHDPVFTSSVTGKPYPVTLAEEFFKARRTACESNRRKFKALTATVNASRAPASAMQLEERKKFEAFHEEHCKQGNK